MSICPGVPLLARYGLGGIHAGHLGPTRGGAMMTPEERVEQVKGILERTTRMYRPGPEITERDVGPVRVIDVWIDTPHVAEAVRDPDLFPAVDVHFFTVSVSKVDAEAVRDEFLDVCEDWPPDPTYAAEGRLAKGPSYIELGAQIGTFMGQQDAMRWMALGEVLGVWQVVTPRRLLGDLPREEADRLAGGGLVMISGYDPLGVTADPG